MFKGSIPALITPFKENKIDLLYSTAEIPELKRERKIARELLKINGNNDVSKACYPNPVKINTILESTNQMRQTCNNALKQLLKTFSGQRLRVSNGTNY